MVNTQDYRKVEIPEDKDGGSFNHNERRAVIYKDALENGGTRSLPNTYREYGSRFDVSVNQIWKDVNAVRQSILEYEFTQDKVREDVASTLMYINEKAKEEDDYDLLRKTMKTYKKWAQDLGIEEKEPEQVEVEHSGLDADKLAEIYEEESEK